MNLLPTGAVQPSRVALGAASFGSEIPADTSFAVMDAYAADGGNFLDTAHIYAAWVPGGWGASERTVGEWILANGVRNSVVVATKGAHPPMDDMTHGRCSRECIRQDLEESLDRLATDHVDLYWLHRDEPGRPVGDIIETLAELQREGLLRACGGSNWTCARLAEANAYAADHGLPPFVASQPGWALADPASPASPVLGMLFLDEPSRRWHEESGLPLAAYTSQAKGYFGEENAAWASGGFQGKAPRGEEYDCEAGRGRLLRAMDLAHVKGCSTGQIALAYLLCQRFPVYPIMGTRNPARVREAMGAVAVRLTPAEVAALRGKAL
jgi:aryl-alcohol dehydrogenase-like predicted oxidoreductase